MFIIVQSDVCVCAGGTAAGPGGLLPRHTSALPSSASESQSSDYKTKSLTPDTEVNYWLQFE